jgi:transposase-like protein
MRKEDSGRGFSRELKLAAVQRMAMGTNVSKLSRELGVSQQPCAALRATSMSFRRRWGDGSGPSE